MSENGCGLLVECTGAAMLSLRKREGRIEVVQKVGKRRTLLASERYAGEKVFLKMVLENGEIRCFFGSRAGEERRIGTVWPWAFLRTDTCHVGPGIGIVSGE